MELLHWSIRRRRCRVQLDWLKIRPLRSSGAPPVRPAPLRDAARSSLAVAGKSAPENRAAPLMQCRHQRRPSNATQCIPCFSIPLLAHRPALFGHAHCRPRSRPKCPKCKLLLFASESPFAPLKHSACVRICAASAVWFAPRLLKQRTLLHCDLMVKQMS